MWADLIAKQYPVHELRPGASRAQLDDAESELGVAIPTTLHELLLETNGVFGEHSLGLVWPVDRIVADNLHFRSFPDFRDVYMPFDSLLFFGDAGNGDQFAFAVLNREVRRSDIYVWDHENDSRTWVAPDLQRYLEWWAAGLIQS
jgi:SMI1-KNR4 cell-wall